MEGHLSKVAQHTLLPCLSYLAPRRRPQCLRALSPPDDETYTAGNQQVRKRILNQASTLRYLVLMEKTQMSNEPRSTQGKKNGRSLCAKGDSEHIFQRVRAASEASEFTPHSTPQDFRIPSIQPLKEPLCIRGLHGLLSPGPSPCSPRLWFRCP